MNQHLKELMIEAGYAAPELASRGQQLAQLIVESCAQEFDNTYMTGGLTMGEYLRRKFGVIPQP